VTTELENSQKQKLEEYTSNEVSVSMNSTVSVEKKLIQYLKEQTFFRRGTCKAQNSETRMQNS